MRLLLLSTALLLCARLVYSSIACPLPEPPPSDNSNVVNIITIDFSSEILSRVSVDGDNLNWVGFCESEYSTCHPPPQDNWLFFPVISRPADISSFLLLANFTFNCSDQACMDNLEFYVGEHDNTGTQTDISRYRMISLPSNAPEPVTTTSPFINIAVRDNGTCAVLNRFRLYYQACDTPFSLSAPVAFGAMATNLTCVNNTIAGDSMFNHMCDNGVFDPAYQCQCSPGFSGTDRTNCIECDSGTYKALVGESGCLSCPLNSNSASPASSECACDTGYMRSNPNDPASPCEECVSGYYMENGQCLQCPANSDSTGDSCTCIAGYSTASGGTSTTTEACSECAGGFFRSSGACTRCPTFSDRSFGSSDNECACVGDRRTSDGVMSTTSLACDTCAVGHFLNVSGCFDCPLDSIANDGPSECTCAGERLTDAGSSTTTTDACSGCSATTFRSSELCNNCPMNSAAPLPTATTCTCNQGYFLSDGSTETILSNCLPQVGFTTDSREITEGDVQSTINILLVASAPTDVSVAFGTDLITTPPLEVQTNAVFMNSINANLIVVVLGNDRAFDNYSPVVINILSSSTYIIGGVINSSPVFSSINVTTIDDDDVSVGFEMTSVRFNESQGMGQVDLVREGGISQELRIEASVTTDGIIEFTMPVVVFPVGGDDTQPLVFRIIDDNSGFEEIGDTNINLVLLSPTQYRDSVTIGSDSLFSTIRVEILNDEAPPELQPLGLEAIIGIAVGGAAAVIVVIIIFILILCICRLQAINRQGFYLTNEDQSKEPPSMLRYSASLRSIASQTVMPVENLQGSIAKENEFYV